MDIWLRCLIGTLIFIIITLIIKIRLMQKSAREIKEGFDDKLSHDTNTLIDISSRDRYLRELADGINGQLARLRSQRHRFLQGDLVLKESVTNISHDLRTPLTAICGYLDLLEQEEVSENARRCLSVIRERTDALTALTEELFRYSVTASAPSRPDLEDIVLNHALEESILAHYAVLKGCRITPVISMPEQKITCRLNKRALSRIFENILGNAIKYSSGDLQITLSDDGEIVFSNHAPGLDEVQAGRLFHRLYTVENAANSTGLGLAIAKELTEQMGGSIFARHSEGLFSVAVRFPLSL